MAVIINKISVFIYLFSFISCSSCIAIIIKTKKKKCIVLKKRRNSESVQYTAKKRWLKINIKKRKRLKVGFALNMSDSIPDLKTLSRRAEEVDSLIGSLQTQLDYLKARSNFSSRVVGDNKTQAKTKSKEEKKSDEEHIDIEQIILNEIQEKKSIDSREISSNFKIHPNDVYGAINSLEADGYVEHTQETHSVVLLTEEGQKVVNEGSPEVKVYQQVPESGFIAVDQLQVMIMMINDNNNNSNNNNNNNNNLLLLLSYLLLLSFE
ncbi:phenylalanyl-tRNA synthetase / phenylalanine--tRNA ligase [Reticulomyxa filosa]|uniref:Phenylalanyl-tRNA synthetase / phenylalanine--tRNA ligase n=1 Tax=Reticulomyxa filosa TaxID=46433 RepID=X6NZP0_RETFI|nr:phenylalanyl-tRNA synthetase / phenylalanine--tRNA ligase [Reticulomyxa filosa]|eukprot:ETO31416.1 phenylalanyl-tRNA synthetase / phenylalanine--tRNA ligase [Reticulomyxa filosa]